MARTALEAYFALAVAMVASANQGATHVEALAPDPERSAQHREESDEPSIRTGPSEPGPAGGASSVDFLVDGHAVFYWVVGALDDQSRGGGAESHVSVAPPPVAAIKRFRKDVRPMLEM